MVLRELMEGAMDAVKVYTFGRFTLDSKEGRLYQGEVLLDAGSKIVDFLHLLISHSGEIVTKDHILEQLWPDQFVSEASISRLVSDTRQLLAQYDADTDYIQTIRGKGFKFIKPVSCVEQQSEAVSQNPAAAPTWWSVQKIALLSIILISLILIIVFRLKPDTQSFSVSHSQRVIVLPVWVQTGDVQDSWAEFGLMSMLTQQLREYPDMQVADVDSVLSGLSSLPYDKEVSATEKYDLVCRALGCETLIVPVLKISQGKPVLSYSIIKATQQSPEFVFHHNSVMESARQLLSHAVGQLVPVMQERLELKPLYSQNQRANMHFAMGVSALHHADYATAEQFLRLALSAQDDFYWARAYLADASYRQGDYDGAQHAVQALKKQADSARAQLFLGNLEANILYAKGQLQESIDATLPLIAQAAQHHEVEIHGNLLMNTGSGYTALGDTEKAINYLNQAITVYQSQGLRIREAQARLNLGNALYLASPNSSESLAEYVQAASTFKQFQANAYLAYAMSAQAQYKRHIGRLDEAAEIIQQVAELYKAAGDEEGLLFVEIELADIAVLKDDYALAIEHATRAFNKAGSTYTYIRSYSSAMLTLIYLNQGKTELIPELLAEQDKYQWFDPRANFALVKASYAHCKGDLNSALTIANEVKSQLGEQWSPAHQAYLDLFKTDAENGVKRQIDYMQARVL